MRFPLSASSAAVVVSLVGLGAACSGGPHGSASATGYASPAPAGSLRVFLTRGLTNGDLRGLMGADRHCQLAADSAGIGGHWVAWLSDSQTEAPMRIKGDGPWVELSTDTLVFPNAVSLRGFPLAPITHDETGTEATDTCEVWTGTRNQGLLSESADCEGWGIGGGSSGQYGGTKAGVDYVRPVAEPMALSSVRFPDSWTDVTTANCGDLRHLLCFEIP